MQIDSIPVEDKSKWRDPAIAVAYDVHLDRPERGRADFVGEVLSFLSAG